MPSHGLLLLAWMLYNIVHRHISAFPQRLGPGGSTGRRAARRNLHRRHRFLDRPPLNPFGAAPIGWLKLGMPSRSSDAPSGKRLHWLQAMSDRLRR
jgi:hypothetical protein